MTEIVWRLLEEGKVLEVLFVDQETRKVSSSLVMNAVDKLDDATATKYMDKNYPRGGNPVKLAADALGLQTRIK